MFLSSVGLRLWVGESMAIQAAPVLRWLLLGVLFNGIAHIPFAWLQGYGRADLTAKAHLVEAPIHLVLLFAVVDRFGVTGAAIAWTFRAFLDLAILHGLRQRLAGSAHSSDARSP
jgi:O-antigen/teichoic acid export membrane protein